MSCPDCEARRKAVEERARSDKRSNDYLTGIIGGGMTLGLPCAWVQDWLGFTGNRLCLVFMLIGCVLGAFWVHWRGDKFGTMEP